jgi:excisionase family DNA binding protein
MSEKSVLSIEVNSLIALNEKILSVLEDINHRLLCSKTVFNLNDASAYSGLSKSHLYHLTSSGKLRFYRPFGKCIFISKDELEEALKQNAHNENLQVDQNVSNYFMKKLNSKK